INHTVSPLGREADQPCPPAEDLKDFLSSKKTFKSGEEKAGSIDNIGIADTLPTEGFLDVKDLSADMKKDWRRPAAVLLRLAIPFRTFGPQRSDDLPKHIEVE
ncbi:MAG: hypothetical protein IKY16_09635, partial [Bacteroidales bacterium]|nr:hypothetical protein [Bacteroidales bacterium]